LLLKFPKELFLASKSPRRAELLKLVRLPFKIINSSFQENIIYEKKPEVYVQKLSLLKAKSSADTIENGIILSADTIVFIDNSILGKPKDFEDAKYMLNKLSGKWHEVYTGFTLLDVPSLLSETRYSLTKVKFKKLSGDEILSYIETKSPFDKAGAYGIQDSFCAFFVEEISGCFYNVIGLPLNNFYVTALDFIEKLKIR